MTTPTQLTRNARRAFQRQPTVADMNAALNTSGTLLGKYTATLPDNADGLRARQAINQAANDWLDRCEKLSKPGRH